MKVCVFGLWHLGSVTAACLASKGHEVCGFDPDPENVNRLRRGQAPLFEPGLDDLIAAGVAAGNLRFSSDPNEALPGVDILWVTFDTPVDDMDRADAAYVQDQIKSALPSLSDGTLVLVSSQMPVGSIQALDRIAKETPRTRTLRFACSPENLRLGKAIDVFLKPDRIVIGIRDVEDKLLLKSLLDPITDRLEWMSVESAEMTKHAINAFLATSVTFANEIAAICERVGANAWEVARGLKTEERIGPKAYLSPGGPFAGGTLARDVMFLKKAGGSSGLKIPLLSSVRASNDEHKGWMYRRLAHWFEDLSSLKIAIWGLTYKPGTSTLRRSLAVELCERLMADGVDLRIFDPAMPELPPAWEGKISLGTSAADVATGANALVIGTDWPDFKGAASDLLVETNDLSGLVVIDPNRFLGEVYDRFQERGVICLSVGAASE